MRTVVLSAPGRTATTHAMLHALERQNPGQPFEVFTATGRDPIKDFWSMLRVEAFRGGDVLFLEDDIRTARNFLAYVARWRSPHLTSFFFAGGGRLCTGRAFSAVDFGYAQALWFPEALLKLLSLGGPPRGRLQDDALGGLLHRLGEQVFYHRSLVQHVGRTSLCTPGATLERRTAADFPGEDFDCLSLLQPW